MAIKPLPTDQSAYVGTDGKPATVFYTWLKSLVDALNGLLLALFPGGITTTAWTAYTPIVTANVGTITAYTATGRSYQLGKVVFVQIRVQITTSGTATGNDMIITLPVTPNSSFDYSLAGWEDTAAAGAASIISGGVANAAYADGTSLINSGSDLTLCGTYEAA